MVGPERFLGSKPTRWLEFDGLRIDVNGRRVMRSEQELQLTRSEFDLLVELARSPGIVMDAERLFRAIWGSELVGDGHAIEVQVSRLRSKLGESGLSSNFITTVRGAGYRFDGAPLNDIVVLEYDRSLRVLAVRPGDRPFFGWHPHEVIGQYFLLIAGPNGKLAQGDAVQMLQAIVATGQLDSDAPYEVQCADGSTQLQRARHELFVDSNGNFDGARVTIR